MSFRKSLTTEFRRELSFTIVIKNIKCLQQENNRQETRLSFVDEYLDW